MIDEILKFYRHGRDADLFQIKHGGFWTSTWTTLAHNAAGASSVAEQYIRMKADGLRHAERVDLIYRDERFAAVVITDLPILRQTIARLGTGEIIDTHRLVITETLQTLMRCLPEQVEAKMSITR